MNKIDQRIAEYIERADGIIAEQIMIGLDYKIGEQKEAQILVEIAKMIQAEEHFQASKVNPYLDIEPGKVEPLNLGQYAGYKPGESGTGTVVSQRGATIK